MEFFIIVSLLLLHGLIANQLARAVPDIYRTLCGDHILFWSPAQWRFLRYMFSLGFRRDIKSTPVLVLCHGYVLVMTISVFYVLIRN